MAVSANQDFSWESLDKGLQYFLGGSLLGWLPLFMKATRLCMYT